jgi:hypothetical protein
MVSREPFNVDTMLRTAFLKAELEFLRMQPRFIDAVATVKTSADFTRLCDLATELLKAGHRTHPSAKQLRNSKAQKDSSPRDESRS